MAAASATGTLVIGGYPVDIFPSGFDQKFLCGMCKNILRDPRQNFCGHRFCMGCAQNTFSTEEVAKRQGKPKICPSCIEEGMGEDSEELKLDHMFPDNAVKREMIRMDTKCCNTGCKWRGKFKDYVNHESQCEHRPIPCSLCGALVPNSRRVEHDQKECPKRKMSCKFCGTEINHANAEVHNQECLKYPTKCDACGKKKIPREQLQDHLDRECSKRVLTCPVGCPEQMNLDKFVQHLTNGKTQGNHLFWIMDKLLNLERMVTGNITAVTPQGELAEMMASINELDRKVQELQTHRQPNDDSQNVSGRLQATEAKVSSFEPIMGVLHKEIERCLQVIESLERQQIVERQRVDQLNTLVEQMDQKIKTVERNIALKDIQLAEHDLRMQCMELASYDGSLLWRITDVAKKRNEAVTGKVTSLYSPAFFTGKVGYKMCARIYLNGDGMGKGSHISLFFVVMRGHYDALMPWPFQQKVTLMMIDQNFREHMVDTFRPDPTSSSFRRPVSEMNIASGCPLFLPLSRLMDSNTGYIKDDVIFVKIIVESEGLDKYTELNPLKGALPTQPPPQKK
ncbi:TNF receptor-associated factor 2-like [Haliotis asinina]|uniref:TNF receptor-associated factor 2-like n=1 Tax=Haliotis asinina TaxID=109174 RepID=UPI0035327E42